MKTWLKTGLIAAGISVVIWVALLALSWIFCEGEGCMIALGVSIFGIPSIIVIFALMSIFGAVLGKINESKSKKSSKMLKTGLLTGALGIVVYVLLTAILRSWNLAAPGYWFVMILIFIAGFIVGALLYKLFKK